MGNIARRRFLSIAVLVLLSDLCPAVLTAKPAQIGGKYRVSIQAHVRAKMRDGVSLVADIYRPVSPEKFPVLVKRTPYNRAGEAEEANELASNGYVVVVQDTRGRYESEGIFYPFRDESNDGYDTVEWAAKLDQSNGKVGMFGGSYVGATQMLAAMAVPPHLLAIFPFVTSSEYYDGWTYQNGALMQWFTSSWTSILAVDTLRRNSEAAMAPKDWVGQLPVEKYQILKPATSEALAPYFHDWVTHELNDSYWKPWRVSDHYAEMKVRGLYAAGWHDLFLKGSIKNYTGLHAEAATPELRSGQRLIIGPWAHAPTSPEGKIGDVVFGKSAVLDEPAAALKWFDYTLKDINNEYASGAPVRLFIMGENVWRDEKEFPLARTQYTKYYLHSTGSAAGPRREGQLSVAQPGDELTDKFSYDPNNPVPTIGGRLCCGASLAPGPFDQKANELRPDVLTFSTPPLERDLEVTGFVSVELYAATSAVDTDFTALLVDVDASGYARFLTDGIVRARYAESTNAAKPISPGKVYKYTIDLWATGNVFKAGHRVRLYISSSNFPRFNRNLNTGEVLMGSSRSVIANQTVYHDREHLSSVTLPVIPRN
ncbi:MAG TPA: CocE/NonD family hydrolase [Pyrinomonadaceae bacterium]|nr:CocE/NonD family hydrolase [Pyrinomonadaceae bacterium]